MPHTYLMIASFIAAVFSHVCRLFIFHCIFVPTTGQTFCLKLLLSIWNCPTLCNNIKSIILHRLMGDSNTTRKEVCGAGAMGQAHDWLSREFLIVTLSSPPSYLTQFGSMTRKSFSTSPTVALLFLLNRLHIDIWTVSLKPNFKNY